jgi:putative NADH-flavin reductase
MPVIVIGADTPLGAAAMDALLPRTGEVRAFVTSPDAAADLRSRGVKVALGDVSDGSHVGGAALNAYCAVLVGEAAVDDRERAFADSPQAVVAAWVDGLNDAAVSRAIVVADHPFVAALTGLHADLAIVRTAGRTSQEIAAEISDLEDAIELPDREQS